MGPPAGGSGIGSGAGPGFLLLLMRHGEAARTAGGGDRARPLTQQGRADVRRIAEAALRAGLRPARALVSPAGRARETAHVWAEALAGEIEVAEDEAIYEGGPEELLGRIRAHPPELATLLVVGHAPALPELARSLARDREVLRERLGGRFPPGTLVALAFAGAGPGSVERGAGEVRAVLPPGSS